MSDSDRFPVIISIDGDAPSRELICSTARNAGWRVQEYGTAASFLASYRDGLIGCLALESQLPDMSGLELQARLVERRIDLPRVFVTSHATSRLAVQAVRGGAYDVLRKPVDKVCLVNRIRGAIEQQRRTRQRRLWFEERQQAFRGLTLRELQVFRCVVSGRPNKSTARHLQISEASVETYRYRLMKKLHVRQLADLMQIWVALYGWSPPGDPIAIVEPNGEACTNRGIAVREVLT